MGIAQNWAAKKMTKNRVPKHVTGFWVQIDFKKMIIEYTSASTGS